MTNSGDKPSAPAKPNKGLTEAEVEILEIIWAFGGMLSQTHLNTLVFASTMYDKLRQTYRIDPARIEQWQQIYPDAVLDRWFELLKWQMKTQVRDPELYASLDPGFTEGVPIKSTGGRGLSTTMRQQGRAWLERVIPSSRLPVEYQAQIEQQWPMTEQQVEDRLVEWFADTDLLTYIRCTYSMICLRQCFQLTDYLSYTRATDATLFASLDPRLTEGVPAAPDLSESEGEEQRTTILANYQEQARAWLWRYLESYPWLPEAFNQREKKPSELFSSAGRSKMKLLEQAKYVLRDERPSKSRQGRGESLFYLGIKARRLLANKQGLEGQISTCRYGAYNNDQWYPHTDRRIRFRISVEVAAKRHGYGLQWYTEKQLRDRQMQYLSDLKKQQSKGQNEEETEKVELVRPDDFFVLTPTVGQSFFHFVEVDRGSERVTSKLASRDLLDVSYLAGKVQQYAELFRDHYEYIYPEATEFDQKGKVLKRRARVVIMTESADRVDSIITMVQQQAGKAAKRYWVGLFSQGITPSWDDYYSTTVLHYPIWQQASRPGQLRPLI